MILHSLLLVSALAGSSLAFSGHHSFTNSTTPSHHPSTHTLLPTGGGGGKPTHTGGTGTGTGTGHPQPTTTVVPGGDSGSVSTVTETITKTTFKPCSTPIHTLGGHYKAIPPLSTTKQNKSNTRNTKSSKDHNRVNMSSKSFKSTTTLDNASTRTTSSTASTLKGMFTKSWKLKAPEKAPSSPKPSSKKAPAKDYTGEAVHHEAVAQYLALR